ncbi:hypothetical protein [Nitrosococcus oceani]|uniref:hypothetical protein n=1 Tax=Nitrosococcus oceani TaxID=1229 RepID=UPI0004E8C665|nr:hypothetical protein [Nitrosococcus oceani]KFI22197.1 hypothetical protein HW44_10990 [Nitrosococcus oceani]
MIDEDLLRLRQSQAWLEMEINDSLLFAGGSAKFGAKVVLVLKMRDRHVVLVILERSFSRCALLEVEASPRN